VGQPMGGHTDSGQALLYQVVDFIGQSCNLGCLSGVGSSL
jgi:hypothetical protein